MSEWLNPDPLRPRGTDDILPSADYVDGYDHGYEDAERARPRLLETKAFGCGVVIGMVLAIVLIAATLAAPRAAADPTSTAPRDLSADRAATSGGPLPTGPRQAILGGSALVRAPHPPAGGVPVVSAPAVITGPATWYDAPTIRDAAAGPALRKALGRGWRDSTVEVCATACIEVVLSDWCACGHGHVIDLDDRAFARLAPLSQGVVRVRIFAAGAPRPRVSPPPTDVWP